MASKIHLQSLNGSVGQDCGMSSMSLHGSRDDSTIGSRTEACEGALYTKESGPRLVTIVLDQAYGWMVFLAFGSFNHESKGNSV